MKTSFQKNVNNTRNQKKGISLVVLVITLVVAVVLLAVVVLAVSKSNPSDTANEAVFRNDFVVLQNELTASKLNEKINDFESKEDINVSMNDPKIDEWLPSLSGSPLKGKVEICNGEVVFIIDDQTSEEYEWAKRLAGSEKVYINACAEAPKVFSPEIEANIGSGEIATSAVVIRAKGGVSDDEISYYYEYSLDRGKTFARINDGANNNTLTFDGTLVREIVQIRVVAIIDSEEVRSSVSEFDVHIDKTGTIAPIITATNGYVSGTWTGDNVEILITSANEQSDEQLEYQIDGGSWTEYNESTHIIFSNDGEYSVKARAIAANDIIGPESTTFKVCINKTLPEAPVISRTDGIASGVWSNKSTVSLVLSSSSLVSYYEYSTDGGNTWYKWSSENDSIKITDEGITNVVARAYNYVGNLGATSNAFTVKIDTVKPVVTTTLTSTTNSITVNARGFDETGSGIDSYIFYKDDEAVVVTKENSYTFNDLVQSTSYKIGCVAIDAAGNRSPVYNNSIYTQTIEEPTIKIDNENWTNTNVTATISKYNNQSTKIEYQVISNDARLEESNWIEYVSPIVVTRNCSIYARAVDSVGQLSTSKRLVVSNIDKINPDLSAPSADVTTNSVVITSNQKDGAATIEYASSGINSDRTQYAIKIDDSWSEYQYDNRFTNLEHDKTYYIKTRVYDNAGNYTESDEAEVKTSKLEEAKIYLTYNSANGPEYVPSTITKNSVYVRLDDDDKANSSYRSKSGSSQFISPTTQDTLVNTSGRTVIVAQRTDGYNVVTSEYEIIIDNVPPAVTNIEVINPGSGKYEQGQKVTLRVNWTENITGNVAPLLTVVFGAGNPKEATYVSSTDDYMIYEYVIEHDDNGYMNLYDYAGGEVLDAVGNVGNGEKKVLNGSKILASNEFSVTLAASPTKGGSAIGATSAYYLDDITILATANRGYYFKEWTVSSPDVILNNAKSPATSFKMPAENVTITANFENIVYKIKYDANTGRGKEFESTHKYDVAQNLAKNTYEKPGYIFTGWSRDKNALEPEFLDEQEVLNLSSENGDVITLYAVWQVGVSEYKIEHYVENVNSTAYILKETENLTGTTDTIAVATPHEYLGFYFDEESEQNILSGNINGEGDLTLKLYYNRKSYTLSVDPNGGVFAGTTQISTLTGKYESSVILPNPVKQGYLFNGWVINGSGNITSNRFTFDADNSEIIAQWKPGTSYYKVEHYREKIDSSGYDLYETENLSGTTESIVTAKIKYYTGFEANTNIEGTVLEAELLPDNSVVLKVYYVRKTYNLTIEPSGGSYKDVSTSIIIPGKYGTLEKIDRPVPPAGHEVTYNGNGGTPEKEKDYTNNIFNKWIKTGIGELSEDQTEFMYLDGDGTIRANYRNDGLVLIGASRLGYDFDGWYLGYNKVGSKDDKYVPDRAVTLNAKWTPRSDTPYKVEHYRENVNKDGYELFETDELEGITDTQAVAINKSYEGFTYDSTVPGSVLKGNIEPDGSLVLKVYYTRNVHNLSLSLTPSGSGKVEKSATYVYGQKVDIKATENPGYLFSRWINTTYNISLDDSTQAETSFIMPDGDVSITAEFTGITYTIVYDINNGKTGEMANSIFTYGNKYNLPANKYGRPGYNFIGWNTDKDAKTAEYLDECEIYNLTTTNSDIITFYAIWSAGETDYNVEHYTENLDGTYSVYQTDNIIGVVDSTVFAEPMEITGFTYDSNNENEIISGINEYENKLTLKLYYTRNSYRLTIDPNTGSYKGSTNEAVINGKFEETVVVNYPSKVGYTFNGWITEGKGIVSGRNYTFGASDEKIKATYKPNNYNVTFMYNGATSDNEVETKEVTFDASYGALPFPKKNYTVTYNAMGGNADTSETNTNADYLFGGWYLTSDFANLTITTEETKVVTAKDHFLYAKWLGGGVTLPEAGKVGYHLDGWYTSQDFNDKSRVGKAGDEYTPKENVTLYAKWAPNDNTPYKVEHYLENVTANGFMLKDTDNFIGTTDESVTAEKRDYTGFEFDSNNENNLVTANILPDGTLVLKVYYVRKTYNLTVDPNGGKFRDSNSSVVISKKYEQVEIIEDPSVPASYTVTYELDGGNAELAENSTTSKFTFTGWTVTGKGSFNREEKVYTFGDGNGNFVANYENSAITLPAPTKVGYTFDAWYEDREFKNKVGEAGSIVSVDSSVTYYARWIPRTDTKYLVKHNLQNIYDNNYVAKDVETLYGTTATSVTATPKTYSGFSFDEDMSVMSGIIAADGSLVINVYYSRNLYSLSINPNGGKWNNTGAISVINKRHGTEFVVSDPQAPESVNVSYELNGGSAQIAEENVISHRRFTGWTKSGAGTFNKETKIFTYGIGPATFVAEYEIVPVKLANVTKQGYVFAGWYEDAQFTKYAGDVEEEYFAKNNVTLYAKWENALDTAYKVEHYLENVDEVTYTLQDTDALNGETDSTVYGTSKSYIGYEYDENIEGTISSGSIAPDGSLVLKLYYKRLTYNVTINPNGGLWRESEANTVVTRKHGHTEMIENPVPPEKYTVTYDLNSGTVEEILPINTDATKVFKSWTKTGKGILNSNVYTFEVGDGNLKANYETNAITLLTPNRLGYTFKGWYTSETDDNGSGSLVGGAGTSYVPTKDITLYAKWEANKVDYKVEHYIQDITGETYTLHSTDTLKWYTDSIVNASTKSIVGFTYNPDYEGNIISGKVSADPNNMLILKLYYTRNSYTLSLSISPATAGNVYTSGSYKYEQVVPINAVINNGYTFKNWATLDSGVRIADTSSSDTTFVMPASDVNITANCSVNGYKITYILNGGTETEKNPTSYTTLTNTITLSNPVKDEYVFTGWTTPEIGEPSRSMTIPKGSIGDKTFTANWQYAVVDAIDRTSNSVTFDSREGTFSSTGNGDLVLRVMDAGFVISVTRNGEDPVRISASETLEDESFKTVVIGSDEESGSYKVVKPCYVTISGANYSGDIYIEELGNVYIADKLPRYTRNAYMNDGTEAVYEVTEYRKFDEKITPESAPARAGYVFKGWSTDMYAPASTVGYSENTSYGYMTENEDLYAVWAKATTYKVEYYRENIAANGYDLYETVKLDSLEGNHVKAEEKDYSAAGFSIDKNVSGTVLEGDVSPDGTLLLKVYYSRNRYNLKVNPAGGIWNNDSSVSVINKTHGTVIEIEVPTRDGYTFAGWKKTGEGTITTVAPIVSTTQRYTFGIGDGEIKAVWTPITVPYKVEHYRQKIDLTFELADIDYKEEKTETVVYGIAKSYTGFTFAESYDDNVLSGAVKGDGSLVLKLYYTRNTSVLNIDPNGGRYEDTESVVSLSGLYQDSYKVKEPSSNAPGYLITYDARGGVPEKASQVTTKTFTGYTKSGGGNYNSQTSMFTFGITAGKLVASYANDSVTLPSATREGYEFNGWYSDEELNNSVGSAGENYITGEDTKLYASWIPLGGIQYKVEHYLENVDGTYPSTPEDIDTYRDGVTESIVTAKSRTYTGFTYDSNVQGTISSGTVKGDGSLVLKLFYTRNKYTLTLTSSGGGSAKTSGSYKYQEKVKIEATPSAGHSFNGWTTVTSGVTIKDTSSSTTSFVMPAGKVDITANFKVNSYTLTVNPGGEKFTQNYNTKKSVTAPTSSYSVSYDSNGGTSFSASISNRGFTKWTLSGGGTLSSTTANPAEFTYGASDAVLTASYNAKGAGVVLPTPTKTGYTFKGWYDSETNNNGSGNLIGDAGVNYEPSKNIKLYAKWEINSYKLTVNPGGEVYVQDYNTTKTVTAPSASYKITYDVNGGEKIDAVYSTRTFTSWKVTGAGSISSTTNTTTTFTFGAGDGTLTANYSLAGANITLPTPKRTGYKFGGWYDSETNNNGSGNLVGGANSSYTPESSMTLYAKWTIIDYTLVVNPGGTTYTGHYNDTKTITLSPKYTIKFDSNGGTSVSDMSSSIAITKWTLSGSGKLSSTTSNPTVFTYGEGDATVTATYSNSGEAITLPANPTKTGYTFKGWYNAETNNNGSGTLIGSSGGSYTPSGSNYTVTLYAKWQIDSHTVTTSSSPTAGGTTSGGGTYNYGSSVTVTASENAGYSFDGWYNGTTKVSSNKSYTFTMGTSNVSLTAKFTAGQANYTVNHYVMNTSGNYPSTATSSETKTGTTGSSVTLSNLAKTTSSYKVTNGIAYSYGQVGGSTVTSTTILGDGSRVINLYYKRYYGTLTTKAGDYVSSVTTQSKVKYYYGATVSSLTATLNSTAGYNFSFSKWASDKTTYMADKTSNPTGNFAWPAMPENTAVTLTANATRSPKVLTITLSNANATSNGATAVYLKYATGIYKESSCTNAMTTSKNNVSVPSRTGYTFGGWYSGSTQLISDTGYITSSFSNTYFTAGATLTPKWTAKSVNYKVEHYVMDTRGNYPSTATSTETKSANADSSVTLSDLKKSSLEVTNGIVYSYGQVGGATVTSTTISPDGTRVIKLYYKRTYGYLTTRAGDYVKSVTAQNSKRYYYGATVDTLTAELSTASSGYSINFSKWSMHAASYPPLIPDQTSNPLSSYKWPAMPEGTEITLYAEATNTANTNTAYKVEHYVMGTDGKYPTSVTSTYIDSKTGTTDSTLTLANLKRSSLEVSNGIVYSYGQVGGSTVLTTKVKGDGTLVIKLYYKRTYGYLTTAAGNYVSSVTSQNKVKYYYGATVSSLSATLNSTAGYNFTFQSWASSNSTYMSAKTSNPTGNFTWPAMPEGTSITLTANASRTAKVIKITLPNTNATSNGATAVYLKYGDGVYKEQSCTNKMTTSKNPVSVPLRTGYTFGGWHNGQIVLINESGYITSYFTNTLYTADTTLNINWDINQSTLNVNIDAVGVGGSLEYWESGSYNPAIWLWPKEDSSNTVATFKRDYNSRITELSASKMPTTKTDETYTVTYNYSTDHAIVTIDTATKTTTTSYTFKEWSKSSPFYGTLSSTTGKPYYIFPANNNVTSTITAKWNTSSSTSVTSVTLPSPTWEGHTFDGWYTAKTGGTKVGSGGDSYIPPSSLNLYTRWTTHSSTLKIDPNGGTWGSSTSVSTKTQNYGTTLSVPLPTRANAVKTDATYTVTYNYHSGTGSPASATANKKTTTKYTFSSWTKSSTFYGTLSSTTAAATYTYPANNGVTSTITANWSSSNSTATDQLTLPTPTRTGYTFSGWYTAETGGTKVGAGGAKYTPTATTTLHAQWTINTSKLTINPNGGTVSVTPGGSTARNITSSTTYTQNYNTTLAYGKPTRSNSVKTDATYTVTYNYHSGTGSPASATANKKTTTSYTFNGWTKSTTFYGTLSSTSGAGTYTYPSNNGVTSTITAGWTSSSSTATDQLTLPTPTRTGHTFNGWYTAETGGNKVGSGGAKYTPTATTTLHAQWSVNSHKFTRSANGSGTISGTASGSINYGTSVSVTASANSGYRFVGWYTSTTAKVAVSTSATYSFTMPANDYTIYARFQPTSLNLIKRSMTSEYSIGSTGISSSSGDYYIYVPSGGAGMQFLMASNCSISRSTSITGTYTSLVSHTTSANPSRYVSVYDSGYYKITLGGGSVAIYNATGINVTQTTGNSTNQCTINDYTKVYLRQLGRASTSEWSYPGVTFSKDSASSLAVTLSPSHAYVVYCPTSGFVFKSNGSASVTAYYKNALYSLTTGNGGLGTAAKTFSGNTTYSNTAAGYVALYTTSANATITAPHGGAIKLVNDLPLVQYSGGTLSSGVISISSGSSTIIHPRTRSIKLYYNTKIGSTNYSCSLSRATSKTGSFTSLGTLQKASYTAYTSSFTTGYHYKMQGYGKFWFLDSNNSMVRFATY